jgi:outer membrane protein OmpA-like peptidoglycan-associated protein
MIKKMSISVSLFVMFSPVLSIAGNIRYMPYTYYQETVNKWVCTDQFVICDKCQPVEYDIQKAVEAAHKASVIQSLHIPKQTGLNRLTELVVKNYITKTVPVKRSVKQKNGKMKEILEVYFAFDSSDLTEEAKHKLDIIINQYNDRTFFVEGYTDSVGSRDYNIKLAQKRAESVAEYLKKRGMKVNILKSIGSYSTKKSDALSRRAEVYVCY